MEINLEVICSITSLSSSKIHLKRHLRGENYFGAENIPVTAERERVYRFYN
jgi:hypothetical protein